MDGQFLVGPVELRTQGQMDRVLEMPEDGFHVGLAVIVLDDGGGRPVMAVGDQDDAPRPVAREGVEGLPITLTGERRLRYARIVAPLGSTTGARRALASVTGADWLVAGRPVT